MNKYYKTYLEKEYSGDFHYKLRKESIFKYDLVGANYVYEISEKDNRKVKFWNGLLKKFSIFLSLFYINRIKGKENYEKLKDKSFLSLSNHVLYLDNVLLRKALKFKKFNIIVTEENNVKGFLGKRFRYSGTIPLPSSNIKAFLNFKMYLKKVLDNDINCVHFFGEKELWPRYSKPRPFYDGVFAFSYDFNKPILPIFLEVKTTKNLNHIKSVTTHIMPSVEPNKLLNKNEAVKEMKNKIEKMYIDKYYEIKQIDKNASLYNISKEGYDKLKDSIEFQKRCKFIESK